MVHQERDRWVSVGKIWATGTTQLLFRQCCSGSDLSPLRCYVMYHLVVFTSHVLSLFAATNPRSWSGDCATFPITLPTIFTAMFVALSLRRTNCSSHSSSALIFCCKYRLFPKPQWWRTAKGSRAPCGQMEALTFLSPLLPCGCCARVDFCFDFFFFFFFFSFWVAFNCLLQTSCLVVWCELLTVAWCELLTIVCCELLTVVFLWHWLCYHLQHSVRLNANTYF